MKCKQLRPGFERESPYLFLTTVTITSRVPEEKYFTLNNDYDHSKRIQRSHTSVI